MVEKLDTGLCDGFNQDLLHLWCEETLTDDCSDRVHPLYPFDPDWLNEYVF